MKKRVLCMMMAAAVAMSTAACGGTAEEKTTAEETAIEETKEEQTEAETTEEETTEEETTEEETTEEETADDEEAGSAEEGFSLGSWDGLTFTNNWLGISLTFPEGSSIGTEEEIRELVGTGQEVMVNSGNYTEEELESTEGESIYDFLVTLPDGGSNLQLMYTYLGEIDLEDIADLYMEEIKSQLLALDSMEYELLDEEDVELGGQTFKKMSLTAMGGVMYQDYYCIAKDGYVANLIGSYIGDSQDVMDEIIDGITGA